MKTLSLAFLMKRSSKLEQLDIYNKFISIILTQSSRRRREKNQIKPLRPLRLCVMNFVNQA
jgi:hypothetical protein